MFNRIRSEIIISLYQAQSLKIVNRRLKGMLSGILRHTFGLEPAQATFLPGKKVNTLKIKTCRATWWINELKNVDLIPLYQIKSMKIADRKMIGNVKHKFNQYFWFDLTFSPSEKLFRFLQIVLVEVWTERRMAWFHWWGLMKDFGERDAKDCPSGDLYFPSCNKFNKPTSYLTSRF